MNTPSALMRDLARMLVALEATNQTAPESHMNEAVRVCEKLRIVLTRFAGADGFARFRGARWFWPALMSPRCNQSMSRRTAGWRGLAELLADGTKGKTPEGTAIIARLLELRVTFVGESLTLQLVREAWSGLSPEEWHSRSKTL